VRKPHKALVESLPEKQRAHAASLIQRAIHFEWSDFELCNDWGPGGHPDVADLVGCMPNGELAFLLELDEESPTAD
jgi:hypothetical protein